MAEFPRRVGRHVPLSLQLAATVALVVTVVAGCDGQKPRPASSHPFANSVQADRGVADAAAPARTDGHTTPPDAGNATRAIEPRATLAPGPLHGNWRIIRGDDPDGDALMAVSIQHVSGEGSGNGDYLLHQPFCDAAAGRETTPAADCEWIGDGGEFSRVDVGDRMLHLELRPGADNAPHELRLEGDARAMRGEYIFAAGGVRLPVLAVRPPED